MVTPTLTVPQVARARGCHRMTAWRWLVRMEREHGAKLVRDPRTRQIRISRDELIRVARREQMAHDPSASLRHVLDRLEELESWRNGASREIAELRRALHRVA